ncbi:MAG: hypothetical protein AMJ88_14695 [Anaerolineae bacterium SM23_ 63]|nr:MAG: hypothetical protein AMJ88_14695 [Anaerolineae bacterium SM23_ 63]HEY45202.1 hypothetical protein [Anaerolineae bacterium]
MIEGNYQVEIQVVANTRMIQHERDRRLRDAPRPEQRGPLWDGIARLGSGLVRLGTSIERFALVNEKIHADV